MESKSAPDAGVNAALNGHGPPAPGSAIRGLAQPLRDLGAPELLRLAQQRDGDGRAETLAQEAWVELFGRVEPSLKGHATRLLSGPRWRNVPAEDLLNATSFRGWEKITTFEGDRTDRPIEVALRAWLHCVLDSTFQDVYVRPKAPPERALKSDFEPPASGTSVGTREAEKEQHALLEKAVNSLPPADQQMIRWTFEDGLSDVAIGLRLGVSDKTAKKQRQRVLARLRQLLGG